MSDNVIDLSARMKRKPPSYGATITLSGDERAEISTFWDDDADRTPAQRCFMFADALLDLVQRLRDTGHMIEEELDEQ